jgi:hypothetical protein
LRATTDWDKNKKDQSSKEENNFLVKGGKTEMCRLHKYDTERQTKKKQGKTEEIQTTTSNQPKQLQTLLPSPTEQQRNTK